MLGYLSGIYDVIRMNDLERIDRAVQENLERENEYFALAIYDDELCERQGLSRPIKSIEDRTKIAQYLSGVDFVFPISTVNTIETSIMAEEALNAYLEQINQLNHEESKRYEIAYAPGTYDLFHLGHLENLLEASKNSKKLIVGVKSDELVKSHKGRLPIITAQERMEILRHFKFVDDVYQYYTRDPHVADTWIKSKYGSGADAVFMGSDLKKDFKDIKDMNIIFTDRDSSTMRTRSTSAYREKLTLLNPQVSVETRRYTRASDNPEKPYEKEL